MVRGRSVFLSIGRDVAPSLEKFIFAVTNAVQEGTEPVDDIVFVIAFVFVVVFASGARPGLRVSQRHLLEIERPNNLPRITSDASRLSPSSSPLLFFLSFRTFSIASIFKNDHHPQLSLLLFCFENRSDSFKKSVFKKRKEKKKEKIPVCKTDRQKSTYTCSLDR